MSGKKCEMIAKTFQGLEGVLAEELKEIGAEDVEIGRRMVSFSGDKLMMYKANFCCRTALRILKPIYTFSATDADGLYDAVKKFEWDKVLALDQTFSIDSTVYSEEFKHSKFVTYRVKDAIADFFMDKYGKRPSIRISNPDIFFNVHIAGDKVTLSLDSSGESLHKRGYRVAQTEAPINEVLAAGLIKLSGWDGNSPLVDPMCGSGTFLIEAALIAANINPGVYRTNFAFERWRDFDQELFESVYNDDDGERDFDYKIYGSDISPKAIDIANKNIKNAGVAKYIVTDIKAIQNITAAPEGGMIITNPPYGERLSEDDIEAFYRTIGTALKTTFKGYKAWMIGPQNEIFDNIGLKPSVKFPILNGSLECELREYVIFDGKYNDFVKGGNSVKNQDFKRPERPARPAQRFGENRRAEAGGRFGDKDRKFGDRRESRFGDKDRKFGVKPEFKSSGMRREDNKTAGEHRVSRYGKRPEPAQPRNPLEERYRKPYSPDATRGRERDSMPRDEKFETKTAEKLHGDEIAERIVKFRSPSLGKENERPIIRGRRNGWKRNDMEVESQDKKENND